MTWPPAEAKARAAESGGGGRLLVGAVTKSFGRGPVLAGVDLDVPAGEVGAVLGPSGGGKTTLLRILAGFLSADAGRASVGDRVLFDGRHSLPPERRGVGIVPQEGALFPHLSVADNVGFGLGRGRERARRVAELLELVGLRGAEAARPFELSGGQQQRVALARALAPSPALLLLDEPFSSLDAALRVQVREEIGRVLRAAQCTTVLVTHDQDEALSLADRVAVLLEGTIAQAGAPRELYAAPTSLAVATFVGDAVVLRGEVKRALAHTPLGRNPLVHAQPDGPVVVVIRPEQIELNEDGARARIFEHRYFGAHAMVRSRLATGEEVAHRVSGAIPLDEAMEVGLCATGPVLAYPV